MLLARIRMETTVLDELDIVGSFCHPSADRQGGEGTYETVPKSKYRKSKVVSIKVT